MKKQTGARIPIFGGIPNRRKVKDIPSVGSIIKDLLKEKSITIAELAKKSEVKIYIVSKVINNVRKLDDYNASKLEEALELPEQFLVKAERKHREWISKQAQESVILSRNYDEDELYGEDEERTKPTKSDREIELEYKNFHKTMKDNITHFMLGNISCTLISIAETYAVVAKVVNLNIREYRETMFQSVDREIKKDFCILTIFEWGRGLPDDSHLNNLDCAIKRLHATEEIERRFKEIGSV